MHDNVEEGMMMTESSSSQAQSRAANNKRLKWLIRSSFFFLFVTTTNALVVEGLMRKSLVQRNVVPIRAGQQNRQAQDGWFAQRQKGRPQEQQQKQKQRLAAAASASITDQTDSPSSSSSKDLTMAIFNLIKGAIGTGILALPSGIAAFSHSPWAAIPATLLLGLVGALSAFTFYSIGKITLEIPPEEEKGTSTASKGKQKNNDASSSPQKTAAPPLSLGQVWKYHVGPQSSWMIDMATVLFSLGVLLTYSICLGDFMESLSITPTRVQGIVASSILCLYPLSLLRDLKALGPVSIVGVLGSFVTCLAMAWRMVEMVLLGVEAGEGGLLDWLLVGQASLAQQQQQQPELLKAAGAATIASSVPASSIAAGRVIENPLATLILISMSATSYLIHYNAPAYLQSVNSNLRDFSKLTRWGFGLTCLVNAGFAVAGFLTFGAACHGNILTNYSPQDAVMQMCQYLAILAVTGGFPFVLKGATNSIMALWDRHQEKKQQQQQEQQEKLTTTSKSKDPKTTATASAIGNPARRRHLINVIILLAVTSLATVLDNAGFVVSFNGALMGSAIAYMFPSWLFLQNPSRGAKWERLLHKGIFGFGIVAAIIGATVTLLQAYAPHILAS